MSNQTLQLPAVDAVDFADADSVRDCAIALIAEIRRHADLCAVERVDSPEAALWLRRVERHLPVITPGYTLRVMPLYDLLYRLVNGAAPDRRFLNRLYLRAFNTYRRRPRTVSETDLFAVISHKITVERDPDFLGKPMEWFALTIERWIDGFNSPRLPLSVPLSDLVCRATLLLTEDLAMFLPGDQRTWKRRLVARLASTDTPATPALLRRAAALALLP